VLKWPPESQPLGVGLVACWLVGSREVNPEGQLLWREIRYNYREWLGMVASQIANCLSLKLWNDQISNLMQEGQVGLGASGRIGQSVGRLPRRIGSGRFWWARVNVLEASSAGSG